MLHGHVISFPKLGPTVHCKKAIKLLDIPSMNTFLMSNKYNRTVDISCLLTQVVFFFLVVEQESMTLVKSEKLFQYRMKASLVSVEQIQR